MVKEAEELIGRLQKELDEKGMNPATQESLSMKIVIDYLKKKYGTGTIDRLEGEDMTCPICGADIDYGGDQEIVGDGTVVSFSCPHCGSRGKAGYDLVFDAYYDVERGDV